MLSELDRLQEEMNRLFGGSRGVSAAPDFPAVNLWTRDDSAVLTAEVPGVDPREIDISLVRDTLTLRGKRAPESHGEDEACHRQEREFGEFARTFQLPFAVDPEKVAARFQNGILAVHMERIEEEKPRKIAVKVS